jgi:hypothetical protein
MTYLIIGKITNGKIESYNTKETLELAEENVQALKDLGVETAFIYPDYDGTPLKYATVSGASITWDLAQKNSDDKQKALLKILDKRKGEYPPIADYLDAKVKQASSDEAVVADGVAQEQAYFQACLLVKENNPKPSEV